MPFRLEEIGSFALSIGRMRKSKGEGGSFDLVMIFPWSGLGFLAASLIRSFRALPEAAKVLLPEAGKFGICAAMVAVGLRSNPLKPVKNGVRPILLGLACWASVALVSLAMQRAGIQGPD